jgi:hypothetical protein
MKLTTGVNLVNISVSNFFVKLFSNYSVALYFFGTSKSVLFIIDYYRSLLLKKLMMEDNRSDDLNKLIQIWKKSFFADDDDNNNNNNGNFMDQVTTNCFAVTFNTLILV